MAMLEYVFMQRALLLGLVLGAVLPCIGLLIILRHQSMLGDALSHSSLAGVALGLVLGIEPLLGAVLACILGAFSIEAIKRRLGRYAEIALAIVMSAGIGLASILSDFASAPQGFHSYLFGSIVAVSAGETWLTVSLSLLVLLLFAANYEGLFLSAYSQRAARLAGIPVGLVDFLFTLMCALMISLASRTVGALIVSSFMVIPAASALLLEKSFKRTLATAVAISETVVLCGLFSAYYLNLKPGGTFVLFALLFFLAFVLLRRFLLLPGRKH